MGELRRIAVGAAVIVVGVILFSIAVVTHVPGIVVAPDTPAWVVRVRVVDQALEERNFSHAFYEWREAYGDALRSGRWEALADVGDAAVRIESVAGHDSGYRAEARRVYLAALLRARAQRSAAGAERIAEAFERLGDAEMAKHARAIAATLS